MNFTTIAILLLALFSVAHFVNIMVLSNRIDYVDGLVRAIIEDKVKIEIKKLKGNEDE